MRRAPTFATMTWARANFLLFDQPANGGALLYEFTRSGGAGSLRVELDV